MIINKATSNPLLVNSLVVLDSSEKPVKTVTEFDTDTRSAALSVGGPITAASFRFIASSADDVDSLVALLEENLKPLVSLTKKYSAKRAMDDIVSPDHFLAVSTFHQFLQSRMAQCTNCSTRFLIYLDDEGNLWSVDRAQVPDVFETLTQVDDTNLTCDNCNEPVALYDENPW